MSTRSVIVRLEAEVSQYVAGMGRSAAATDDVARRVVNTRNSIAANEEAMKELGGSFLKVGAVGVAALGATAKAAMDWETAWAGVTKTVEGTPAQLNQLESGLRGLAKTLPITHTEIAGVAEAAGQLGVARKDVVGFTKTMIDLGVSTNLTAEEAATDIAQISNVMGTLARDGTDGISRFGATLVALGNDGASTEKEILSMAQRIAGAGATVGATEVEVLALSNTLASMGVRAELGGGVATRVLLKMYGAVQDGGDELKAFASTAGVSMDEFSKAFADSPVQALDMVNKGLARVKDEGGNVVQSLTDMGLKGTENMQVMLAMAASGDLLANSLELGGKSWQENMALLEEAGKRYDTTASKITISWNRIKDAAITAGAALLPVITTVAEGVAGLTDAFGSLPAPAQQGVILLAAVGTGALLLGGTLLTVIPKIAATSVALQTLNTSGSRIPATMGKVGKGLGIAAGAFIALAVAAKVGNAIWGEAALDVEEFGQALIHTGGSMSAMDNLFADTENGINGVGDAMVRFSESTWADELWNGVLGFLGMDDSVTRLTDSLGSLDNQMAVMVGKGETEKMGQQFKGLAEEATRSAEAQGKTALTVDELLNLMPQYKSALQAVANEAGVTLTGQELLNFALGETPAALTAATTGAEAMAKGVEDTGVALDGVIESMDKFIEQLFATGQLTMSSREAQFAYQETLRGVQEQVDKITASGGAMGATLNENATDFNMMTDAGKLANDTFQGLARDGMSQVEALAKAGVGQTELQGHLSGTYADLITVAGQFGITGSAADELARKVLGVPDGVSIETWIDDVARTKAAALEKQLNDINGKTVDTYINTHYKSIVSEERIANAPGGSGGLQRSAGGPIIGPGTGTSDDVPIWGSNGEHMLTTQDVLAMGGQDAVYRFRAGLHSDKAGDGSLQLASGGAVASRGTMVSSPRSQGWSPGASSASPFDSASVDRLIEAVTRARPVNYNAPDLSKGSFKEFVREMEGM